MAKKSSKKGRRPLGADVEQPPIDRGHDEIDELEARAKDEGAGGDDEDHSWQDLLATNKEGKIKNTGANIVLILENHPAWKGALVYDERSLSITWAKDSTICNAAAGDPLKEHQQKDAAVWFQSAFGISASLKTIYETMIVCARGQSVDPVREWVESLEWDGVERLDSWLPDATGCVASRYAMAVGRKFMISAIARALRPGCKVDAMLILCGPQGTLKSTMLATLGGAWFTDQIGEIGSKDTLMQIHGPWLIEMSELDSMGKREASAVKAFLTTTTDRFRPPYGRSIGAYPRRCVFAGTTNLDTFLRDDTGGRRFWPIKIEEIDIDFVESCREQIYAEAAHAFAAGEQWWLPGDEEIKEEAEAEQEDRRQVDPWEEKVASWISKDMFSAAKELMIDEVLEGIGVDISRRDRFSAMRVGHALKRLGWTRHRRRIGGVRTYVYLPPVRLVSSSDVGEPSEPPPALDSPQQKIEEGY